MAKKNQLLKVLITVLLLIVIFIFYQYNRTAPIISLSVSTDGRYVISAHATEDADRHKPIGQLVLWDIEKKERQYLPEMPTRLVPFLFLIAMSLCGRIIKILCIFKM